MDFEQIKNQFLKSGRQALDYIRNLPKPSESLGIPYAREINQYINTGKLQKDIVDSYKLSQEQLPIAGEILSRKMSSIPTIIQANVKRPSEALGIPFAKEVNKLITGETSEEQQRRATRELKTISLKNKELGKQLQEISKKYGAENVFSLKGATSGLIQTVPSITGQLGIPALIFGVSRNLPLAVSTSRGFASAETYSSSYLEALGEGATQEQANQYAGINTAVTYGLTRLPIDNLLLGMSKPARQEAAKSFTRNLSKELLRVSKAGVRTGLGEMTEETAQQLVSNAAKITYKDLKELNLTEGLTESAFLGFLGGGIMGGTGAVIARPELDVTAITGQPTQTFESRLTIENVRKEADKYKSIEEINKAIKEKSMEKNMHKVGSEKYKIADQELNTLRAAKVLKEGQVISGDKLKQPTEKVSFQTNNNKQTVELNNNQVVLKNDFGKGKTVETTIDLDNWNTLDKTKKIALLRKSYFDAKKGIVDKDDLEFYFFYNPNGKGKSGKVDKVIEYSINNIDKLAEKYKNLSQQKITPTEVYVAPIVSDVEIQEQFNVAKITDEPKNKFRVFIKDKVFANLQNKLQNELTKLGFDFQKDNVKDLVQSTLLRLDQSNTLLELPALNKKKIKEYIKALSNALGISEKEINNAINSKDPVDLEKLYLEKNNLSNNQIDTIFDNLQIEDLRKTREQNNAIIEPEPTPKPSDIKPEREVNSVSDVVNKIEDDKIKQENEVGGIPTTTPDENVDINNEVNEIENLLNDNKPKDAIDYIKKLPLEKGEKVYKFYERVAEGRTDLNPNFVYEVKEELLKYKERNLSKEVKELIERDNQLLDEVTKLTLINEGEDILKIASDVQELVDTGQLDEQLHSQEVYNRVFDYMRRNKPNESNVNLYIQSLFKKLNYNGQENLAKELSSNIIDKMMTASGQSVILFKYFLTAEKVVRDVTSILLKGTKTLREGLGLGRTDEQLKNLNTKIEQITNEIGNKLGFLKSQFGLDTTAINEVYNKVKDLSVEEVNRLYKLTGDTQEDNLKENIDVVEDLTKSKEIDKKLDETFNPETNPDVDVLTGLGITGNDKNKFTGKSNKKKNKLFKDIDDDGEEVKEPYEILANKFDRDIDLYLNTKPAKYRDVVKQMIAQLYKVGKEKLPKKFLDTPEGRIKSLYENLREALKNVDEYSEVWNEAKVIIYDKYGNDPKVEAILIDFFNRDIPNVFSDSDAKRVYKDLIRQNNIKFKDLVKTTLQNIDSTKLILREKLLENLDLDIKTAQTLVDDVYKLFDNDVKKAINTPGYLTKLRPSTPELILNKVDKDIDELLQGKPAPVIESFKRQVRRLARVAKERLPFDKKLQREKSNNEFFKDLGIALKDYREYRYNWARFRQMLSDKYKNNQAILDLTKDIVGTNLFNVFTPSEFNRVFSIVKKDLGISFNNLVKQTNQDIEAKKVEAQDYLLNKLGITREQAGSLLNKFTEEFDNQVIISRNKGQAIRVEPSKAEKVAEKLFAYSENTRADQESKQIANDLITQYLRIARGFFNNIGDVTNLTPEQKFKLLRETIRKISLEQKKYYKLHQEVLNIVRQKYKNNPIALEQLEEYFNGIIPGSFTKSQIKQTFSYLTSDIDFVSLVKSHFSKRSETIKDLEVRIMNDFGLSQKDATKITNEIYTKFNEKYNSTIKNEINKRLRGIEQYASGKQFKDLNSKFIEYVNLGFFNSQDLADVAKKVFNIPVISPEINKTIQTEIWKMQKGEQSITDAYTNIAKEMIKKEPFSWKNIFRKARDFNLIRRQIFYSNILSGIQTFLRNAYGFIFEVPTRGIQITTEAAINSLRKRFGFSEEEFGYQLRDVPTYYIELFRNVKQASSNAKNVWSKDYIPRTASQFSEKEFGLEKIYEVLYGKQTWAGLRVVANSLEMVDQFGVTLVTQAESTMLQSKGMSKEEADKRGFETAKRLFLREDIIEGTDDQVKAQIGAIDAWINKFTKWILKAKQTENVVLQAVLDQIFPIVTVGSNLLKQKLERNLIAQGVKIATKVKYKGDVSTRDMASLVIAFGLFVVAWEAFVNGDIQGELPQDEEERKRAEEAGRKRNSVRFGDFWIPFQYLGSNASMFEIFAALQDTKDSKQFLERNLFENFTAAIVNTFLKVGNETALRGFLDINKTLTADNVFTNTTVSNMLNNSVLNSFMLYRSFFRDLAEISDEYQRKYEGPLETLMSGLPGLRKQLEPKYDFYGEPMKSSFDTTVLPYPIGKYDEQKDQEFKRLMNQAQLEVQARNLPEVKERKQEEDIAKGKLRKILEDGINKPGNFEKASEIVKENDLSSADVTAVQNKVLENKLNTELPQKLKGLVTLTEDQLDTVSKISDEMKSNVEEFREIENKVKLKIKKETKVKDAKLRKLTTKNKLKSIRLTSRTRRTGRIKLRKPKFGKRNIKSGIRKIKLKKIQKPKLNIK